jgi:hypothetical protein
VKLNTLSQRESDISVIKFKSLRNKAFTLAYVLFFSTFLLSVILVSLSNHTMNVKKLKKSGENYDLRAYEVAKAGLIVTL